MISYQRFISKGHDNPFTDAGIKRLIRKYPLKRNTWGVTAKSKALQKRRDAKRERQHAEQEAYRNAQRQN